MKKILWFYIVLAAALSVQIASSAEIPGYYDRQVNDFAKLFSPDETSYLKNLHAQNEQSTTAEAVVVTVNSTAPYALSEYAVKIFDEWKVGKADKDNGLVILYSLSDKKIWVSTGYGLEGILPDSKIGRLLDEYYVPLRDANRTKEGIISVTEQLVLVIEENKAEVISGQAGPKQEIDYISIIIWILFAYFILSRIMRSAYKNKKKKDLPWFFPVLIPFPSRSSGSGFSSGGFGGGFGGGGFGGGGGGGGGAGR